MSGKFKNSLACIPFFVLQGASPAYITIDQQDGSHLKVGGKGTMFIHYTETEDGYVVVQSKSHIYEYARRDESGNLVPSGVKAHDSRERKSKENRYLKNVPKHLAYSGETLTKLTEKAHNSTVNP